MHAVVEQQLGRVGVGAVNAVYGVLIAAAVETGADQLRRALVTCQTIATRASQYLGKHERDIQWDDLSIHRGQLAHQLSIKIGGQARHRALQAGTEEVWRPSYIRQQPDHDVSSTGTLQRLHTINQATGGRLSSSGTGYLELKEIIAAAGNVVERIGIGAQPVASEILIVNRTEDLIGSVAPYRPVIAACIRSSEPWITESQLATQEHGRYLSIGLTGLISRADPVGEATSAA